MLFGPLPFLIFVRELRDLVYFADQFNALVSPVLFCRAGRRNCRCRHFNKLAAAVLAVGGREYVRYAALVYRDRDCGGWWS